jgi:HD-like signal output (HDOD) protein
VAENEALSPSSNPNSPGSAFVEQLRRWFGRKTTQAPVAGSPAAEGVQPGEDAIGTPASLPGPPEPSASREEARLETTLKRAIERRCDILARALSPEARQSDAPLIIDSLRRLDDSIIRQPPVAAQRALAVARNPTSGLAELTAIFEQDPALTEALLQMANSSFYHRGGDPCLAIGEAIQRVGMRGVEAIVTVSMATGLLCRPGGAYASLLGQVWEHMMRTAPVARVLAAPFRVAPETAFTVGLLHDAGKLMIFDYLSQLRALQRREIVVPERTLLDLLNRLHEPLGGMAGLRWNLGFTIAHSIAWHHREPPPEGLDLTSELLCVAEKVDHAIRTGFPLDLEKIWRDGELTTDMGIVREYLTQAPGLNLSRDRG